MKRKAYLPLVALVATSLIVTGCFGKKDAELDEVVDNNTTVPVVVTEASTGTLVTVDYIGRIQGDENATKEQMMQNCDQFEVFDTSHQDLAEACGIYVPQRDYTKKLEFIVGQGGMIPGFEKAIIGRQKNDTFTITIPKEEAYGERSEENEKEVPLSDLPAKAETGAIYEVGDKVMTFVGPLVIKKIEGETVTLDTNHFLAGKDLIFDVVIVDIASAEEAQMMQEKMIKEMEEKAKAQIEQMNQSDAEGSTDEDSMQDEKEPQTNQ